MTPSPGKEAQPRAPTPLAELSRTSPDRRQNKRLSPLRQAVSKHYDLIMLARDQGWRYAEIAEAFEATTGYAVAPETLRKYVSQERSQRQLQGSTDPQSKKPTFTQNTPTDRPVINKPPMTPLPTDTGLKKRLLQAQGSDLSNFNL